MNRPQVQTIMQFALDPLWEDATCQYTDPEIFFALDLGSQVQAKEVCDSCPIRMQCLDYAIQAKIEYGIFGGFTPEERNKIKKTLH